MWRRVHVFYAFREFLNDSCYNSYTGNREFVLKANCDEVYILCSPLCTQHTVGSRVPSVLVYETEEVFLKVKDVTQDTDAISSSETHC